MATYGGARRPPRKPTTPSANTVSNVVNTGQRATSSHTTGATGAVTNTIRQTTVQGSPGRSGSSSVSINTSPAPAAGTNPPDYGAMVNEHITQARTLANTRAVGAFDQAEAALAAAQQRVLGQVPAEYRDHATAAFKTASDLINKQRQRFKG